MKVREGQRVGELAVLIASLAVYGGMLLHDRHPLPDSPPPWGDQGSERIAIEITDNRGADGIYFLPKTTAVAELSKITGNDMLKHPGLADIHSSYGSAISVSTEGGVLKITDMSSVKRLALGLPIDLNRASEEDLLLVPGIGERMAAQIVQLRHSRGSFERLSDLIVVPGIKERKLRDFEKYLTVGPVP
jgi:hypothetical protein